MTLKHGFGESGRGRVASDGLLAGDRSAVRWLATWWGRETSQCQGNVLGVSTALPVLPPDTPGQRLET